MESHPTPEELWKGLPLRLSRQIDSWRSMVDELIAEHDLDLECFAHIDELILRLTWTSRLAAVLSTEKRYRSLYAHLGHASLYLSRERDFIDARSVACSALGSNCFSVQKLWPKRNQFLQNEEWRVEPGFNGDLGEVLEYLDMAIDIHLFSSKPSVTRK